MCSSISSPGNRRSLGRPGRIHHHAGDGANGGHDTGCGGRGEVGMALNPVTYTEKVVGDFLRYQLTAYAFADERLRDQMRQLLSLDETRHSPLLKGPYISLSRAFRSGAPVAELVADGVLH